MVKLFGTAVLAAAMIAGTAGADVKAGVDAWGRGEYGRAVQEWRSAAVAGDADAQFNMGQAYKLGRGVPVDLKLAETWFLKAADQGHQQAQDNYGLALFQSGRKAEAASWLERSALRGESRTQLVLGTMLFNGDGVPRDPARAYALMTRASQAGLQSASATLAQMDQYVTAQDRERGLQLAQTYAAGTPEPAPKAARRKVAPPAPATRGPAAPPIAKPVPKTAGGAWRIQLGAFRDRGNAETLWSRVHARIAGAQPAYVTGGGVTRLQATGFASKAEAQRACTATAAPCVVVAP